MSRASDRNQVSFIIYQGLPQCLYDWCMTVQSSCINDLQMTEAGMAIPYTLIEKWAALQQLLIALDFADSLMTFTPLMMGNAALPGVTSLTLHTFPHSLLTMSTGRQLVLLQ